MRLSKKSRYAFAALMDLAANEADGYVALGSIAERGGISPQYLEQVFAGLKRAGIVKSVKGSQGGYRLNRPASQITAASVVEAMEGSYYVESEAVPAESENRAAAETLQTRLIDRLNDAIDGVLKDVTLRELADCCEEHSGRGQDMYYI